MTIKSRKHVAQEAEAFTKGPYIQVINYMKKRRYNNIKLQ